MVCSNQEALQEKVQSLEGRLKTSIRDLNGAKKNAKFDKIALEGRTKTALVLEHTVATLRHDLQTNVERRRVPAVYGVEYIVLRTYFNSLKTAEEQERVPGTTAVSTEQTATRSSMHRSTHPALCTVHK